MLAVGLFFFSKSTVEYTILYIQQNSNCLFAFWTNRWVIKEKYTELHKNIKVFETIFKNWTRMKKLIMYKNDIHYSYNLIDKLWFDLYWYYSGTYMIYWGIILVEINFYNYIIINRIC